MGSKILIVEDNDSVAFVFAGVLKEFGHFTDRAETIAEAMEKLRSFRADMILLDLILPGSNIAQTILSIETLKMFAPIIVVTGCGDEKLAAEAISKGAKDFIEKPVKDFEAFNAKILKAIESENLQKELISKSREFMGLRDELKKALENGK